MPGELVEGRVWILDQAEANRVYNKGRFGRPRSGGSLELDLVEAVYLVEHGRLDVASSEAGPSGLYVEAATHQDDFEVRFQVYQELRDRGEVVRVPDADPSHEAAFEVLARDEPKKPRTTGLVRAVSERSPTSWTELERFCMGCEKQGVPGTLGVVDEESDVTFYEAGFEEPKGALTSGGTLHGEAVLLLDRVILTDGQESERLYRNEFFGRLAARRLHLSLVEAAHLATHRGLVVRDARTKKRVTAAQLGRLGRKLQPEFEARRRVFDDLKARRLTPKTGYKFGTHFRVYDSSPESGHAPFLVHVMDPARETEWPSLSRAVRLAHGVRKTLLLAAPRGDKVRYVRLRRAR